MRAALAHHLESAGERLQRALEDAQAVGDDEAVVGDRHAGLAAAHDAAEHLAPVGGAGAAVDDQAVVGQGGGVGKIVALHVVDLELAAHVLGEPARDLDAADVFADRVVAAVLGDEDAVAGAQLFDGERAGDLRGEVALEAGEQDGEARHGHVERRVGRHLEERLRVGDDQLGRTGESRDRVLELALLDDQRHGVGVHEVADGLHLRQDEAAARGLLVDRHDQHGELARTDQVAEDGGVVDEVGRRRGQQRLAKVEHAAAQRGGGAHDLGAAFAQPLLVSRRRARQVDLVEHDHGGDLARRELLEDHLFVVAPLAGRGDQHTEVGAFEDLQGAGGAQLAQGADVVDAGRVDEQHGTERQQFHGLLDRVGGGAGLV